MDLQQSILERKARVGIIGMGYVGLPLARVFTEKGFRVLGFDIDATKVGHLNAGRSYIKHVDADKVKAMRAAGFAATVDFARLEEADAIIICVPTPLTRQREPDMSYIVKTGESITPHLRRGQLVVLESTTYPGTTVEVLQPILEKSGLKAGTDFLLAFSPEREDPGNPKYSTEKIPKVVGGIDKLSQETAAALYGQVVVQVVQVSSTQAAEATKLLENIYRCINIALVNELKVLFDRMGIDVWEVIEAASTKPFGYQPFWPGPGLGGHCIPIDPFYLTWKAREYEIPTRFIELAGEINAGMPLWVVQKTADALNQTRKTINGSRILILGAAYKADVDDVRESPAIRIIELLEERGAQVCYHDPWIPRMPEMRAHPMVKTSVTLTEDLLRGTDAVVIVTAHSNVDYAWVVKHAPLVIDSRNATKAVKDGREKIVKA